MSWSSLPDDVVHFILAKVCLIDLASITTTCSSFRAAYRMCMAGEQEARRHLAVNTFGAERIACTLDVIVRLLLHEPLPPKFTKGLDGSVICADGVLRAQVSRASLDRLENGDIRVCYWKDGYLVLHAYCGRGSSFNITIDLAPLKILATPVNDEDLMPMAFVLALLDKDLAQIIRDDYHAATIVVQERFGESYMASGGTRSGWNAQIVPLLPCASLYRGYGPGEDYWLQHRLNL